MRQERLKQIQDIPKKSSYGPILTDYFSTTEVEILNLAQKHKKTGKKTNSCFQVNMD